MSQVKKSIAFLDLDVILCNGRLEKKTVDISICTTHPHIKSIWEDLLYLARLYMPVQGSK